MSSCPVVFSQYKAITPARVLLLVLLLLFCCHAGMASDLGPVLFTKEAPLPFSFRYGGTAAGSGFPAGWQVEWTAAGGGQIITGTDPATQLEVRCEARLFPEYGAVEWVLHLTNKGAQDSALIEDLRTADFLWGATGGDRYELFYAEGSTAKINDFQPMTKALESGVPASFAPFGGRPSDGFLPFFNLAAKQDHQEGIVVAIGWTGQWNCSFEAEAGQVHVRAGLETAHFRLHPGESVRTPSVLVMPWAGKDQLAGQNRFRRLLLEHYVPQYDGAPVKPLMAVSPHAVIAFEKTTEANMAEAIQHIAGHRLPVDYFWIDAGWFVSPKENWARGVGNLTPDPVRFPRGMKPVADAAHAGGMRFLLWFEPERVMPDTYLYQNHPDWLLKPAPDLPEALRYQFNDGFHLLDLANPDAAQWLTQTVLKEIGETGIDAYRNDFNMYPASYWREGEAEDRQGMHEIKYVQALYDYFDALRAAHPNLLLDTCASGGRRIDLEMLKRALILTRSDYLWDPVGQQCHTYGLAQWLPITGIGAASTDSYSCRSGYGSHFTFAFDCYAKDEAVWDAVAATQQEWRALAPLYREEFYPLTPYSLRKDAWMAWQFHDPKAQKGLVQAFRREECTEASLRCVLQGLDHSSVFEVTNLDTHETLKIPAAELLSTGIVVTLSEKPAAALFTYELTKD